MEQEKITNRSARKYLRKVRTLLPCSRKMKDEITAPLRRSMAEYLSEQQGATAAELQARFGTPEVIAASCLEDVDTTEVLRRLLLRRRVLTVVITAVILILLSWGCTVAIAYHNFSNSINGRDQDEYTEKPLTNDFSDEGLLW